MGIQAVVFVQELLVSSTSGGLRAAYNLQYSLAVYTNIAIDRLCDSAMLGVRTALVNDVSKKTSSRNI